MKRLKFGVTGHFLEYARRNLPWNFCMLMYLDCLQNGLDYGHGHADVSWPPSELIRLWSRSVDFPPFGATYLGFPGIIWRMFESKCRVGRGGIFPMLCRGGWGWVDANASRGNFSVNDIHVQISAKYVGSHSYLKGIPKVRYVHLSHISYITYVEMVSSILIILEKG